MLWNSPPIVRRIMEDLVVVGVAVSLLFGGYNAYNQSLQDTKLCEANLAGRQATRVLVHDLERNRISASLNFQRREGTLTVERERAINEAAREYLKDLDARLLRIYPDPKC